MRKIINKKFEGISHKWVKIPLDNNSIFDENRTIVSNVIDDINKSIVNSINNKELTKEDAVNLFKSFKKNGFIWAKYTSTVGRKDLVCNCIVQTVTNKKVKFTIKPKNLILLENLNGTPKSLKLYNMKKEEIIVDPKDGFDDGIYPPAWMVFTPWAYEEYKQEYYEKQEKLKLIN